MQGPLTESSGPGTAYKRIGKEVQQSVLLCNNLGCYLSKFKNLLKQLPKARPRILDGS